MSAASAAQREAVGAALSPTEGRTAYQLGLALPPVTAGGTLGAVTRPAPLTLVLSALASLEGQGRARRENDPKGSRWYLAAPPPVAPRG